MPLHEPPAVRFNIHGPSQLLDQLFDHLHRRNGVPCGFYSSITIVYQHADQIYHMTLCKGFRGGTHGAQPCVIIPTYIQDEIGMDRYWQVAQASWDAIDAGKQSPILINQHRFIPSDCIDKSVSHAQVLVKFYGARYEGWRGSPDQLKELFDVLLTHAKHELFAGRTTPITCKELSHAQYERYLRAKGELVYPWGPPLSMLVSDGQCAPLAYERQLPPHSFTSAPLSHKQVQRIPNEEILPPPQSDDINTIAVREESVVDAAKPCTGFMFDAPVRPGKGAGGLYEQLTFAHKASQVQTHRSTNAITTAQESPTVSHATASSELMPDAASDLVEISSAHASQPELKQVVC